MKARLRLTAEVARLTAEVERLTAEVDGLVGHGCSGEVNALALLDLYHAREQAALAEVRRMRSEIDQA